MTVEREMPYENGEEMDAQLERILEEYAASEPGPSRATLPVWIREYPQFAQELTEFAARWQLMEWAGDDADNEPHGAKANVADEENERLILRGMSAAQSVFYARRAARAKQVSEAVAASVDRSPHAASEGMSAAIDSLIAAAGHVGLTYPALRDRVGLSDALLQKLNRRLIDPLTIPVRVIADLAGAVQQRVESVAAYFALAPTFAIGAQHRANQTPTLPKAQEDFFDAVRNDATLRVSRKDELLALPRPAGSVRSHEDSQ